MAALTKDRRTPYRPGDLITVPAAAAAKLFAGSLAARRAAGYAAPASTAANLVALGRVEELADNSSGADGDINVKIRRGVFRWANSAGGDEIMGADIGSDAYIVDDQTVAKTHAGNTRSKAGRILGVESAGVWVETR